jgi:hypothetical protein
VKARSPNLHAFVARGAKAGTILYPHVHADGGYVVSMTRFEKDYVRVADPAELLSWLERGYRLRMSNLDLGVPAPSLIHPKAIYRPVRLV